MKKTIELPGLEFERELWQMGKHIVVGMDEAGRGALAGPVFVGAVVLPFDSPNLPQTLMGVRDSKQMTHPERTHWARIIQETATCWATGQASAAEIDKLGIVPATRLAGERALQSLVSIPDFILTDYRLELPAINIQQISFVRGDQTVLSIAAASVLAKFHRDAWMQDLDKQYPGYGLGQNKGYGTEAHRVAIHQSGHSPIHRKTFRLK